MKNTQTIIQDILRVDLQSVSNENLIEKIRQLGKIALFGIKVPMGTFILRSRNSREWINFKSPDKISYISDPAIIPEIGRANLDGISLFYGSIPHTNTGENINQIIAMAEASKILHLDPENEIEEYATLGKWRVIEDFTVAAVVSHDHYFEKNTQLKAMNESFEKYIQNNSEDIVHFNEVAKFLSDEFAKKINESWEYKISAATSKILLDSGVAGIIYPSSGAAGEYFNIALRPSIVDQYLRYEKAGVWRMLKQKKSLVGYPYLYSGKLDKTGKFIWEDAKRNLSRYQIDKLHKYDG